MIGPSSTARKEQVMAPSAASGYPVKEVMRGGVIKTPPQPLLQQGAAQMAGRPVHCIIVEGLDAAGALTRLKAFAS
ncbi:MAG: hypothetical protein ABSG95_00350 [Solirubrobacteraceae bacterium]|jgi:hypothetical protein